MVFVVLSLVVGVQGVFIGIFFGYVAGTLYGVGIPCTFLLGLMFSAWYERYKARRRLERILSLTKELEKLKKEEAAS